MKHRKLSIRIHPAGTVIIMAGLLLCDSRQIIAAFLALTLHEGAHLLIMLLCGMRECTIEITPFGGMADVRHFDSYSAWKRMMSAVSGIAASFVGAWLCRKYALHTDFWHFFYQASLSLALLNSLPAWPLDGARVLGAFASCFDKEREVRRIMTWFTLILGVLFAVAGLYGVWHGVINPSLLLCGPYLCYAAHQEQLSENVRRFQRAEFKWKRFSLAPVILWAGRTDNAPEQFLPLIGRSGSKSLQLFLTIDPQNGQIENLYTERSLLDHLLKESSN